MEEVRLGSITLQPHRQLLADGHHLHVGKRALDILSVLAEAQGEVVTKDELMAAVWPGVIVEENALQVHIVALRKALGFDAERLKTIRGVGYRLDLNRQAGAPGVAASPVAVDLIRIRRWPKAYWARLAMLFAGVLALAMAGWALSGRGNPFAAGERIPVVVHQLSPSGSGDPTEAALASGITDELIVRLRRLPGLRIATAEREGRDPGKGFANAHIVDGHIRRNGNQVRVTARLVRPDGEIVWSETFDRKLADLFDLQELIASNIAGALSVSFDVGGDPSGFGGTDNPDAYAAYLQFRINQVHSDQSVPLRYLEQALALDPDYGKALNALSVSYGIRASGASSAAEARRLLAEMDKRTAAAVAANPDLWITHLARQYYYSQRRNLRAAQRSMERVARLDRGNDPELRANLAAFEMTMGRIKRSVSIAQSMEMIDPIFRGTMGGSWNELYLGHYDKAIELSERDEAERGPQAARIPFWALLLLGRDAEAIALADRYGSTFGRDLVAFRAETRLPTMSRAELERWVMKRYGDGNHHQLANLAVLAGIDGHPKLAVELLRIAHQRPAGGYGVRMFWHPALAEARKLPEFTKLVTDLGFVEAWRESGDWGDFCRPAAGGGITCS